VPAIAPKKAIVVLPFANLSPDPENAYFADGLMEEVIADLSRVRALTVISRTSSVKLKETGWDLRRIGRELNVGYALEGSVRRAGKLCEDAMNAMVARAKPGVKEYELKAAAASAIMDGGGDIDFLIIGSTPMDNPALIFGNPRPSSRVLKRGDLVNMELAAGYRGYTAQIGSPITLGPPTDMVRKFWEEITLPGYNKIMEHMRPNGTAEGMRKASEFFRKSGCQSRPTQCHGIDIVTDNPHICLDHIAGIESDMTFKPGMVIMAEPNPITADGMFGIFLGHTYIITDTGNEIVDDFPFEIAVAG